jgi:putative hydrolase of the HAD superfamily
MSPQKIVRAEAVIFDGDDTLWETQPLYDQARNQFFDLMASLGFNRDLVISLFIEIDKSNVAKLGFSRHRFPMSMVEVYERLIIQANKNPNSTLRTKVYEIGLSVFNKKAPLISGAKEMLQSVKQNYRIYLFTAGDQEIQAKRIEDSSIKSEFDSIFIASQKNEEEFRKLLRKNRLLVKNTWMVGNSLRSDINPALKVGLRCIWYRGGSWEYDIDVSPSKHVWVVSNLSEIPHILNSNTEE